MPPVNLSHLLQLKTLNIFRLNPIKYRKTINYGGQIMKVHFQNEIREFENTSRGIDELIENINSFIKESGLVFSHLNIDGVNIYADYEDYMLSELRSIDRVTLVLKTIEEVVVELQQSLSEYLERALPVMQGLSEQFYQGESADSWNSLADLMDGLQWIMGALYTLTQSVKGDVKEYYLNVIEKIESVLQELLEALEAKDAVSIADIIQYEIVDTLAELRHNVQH